ncbi:cyclase [Nakamurella sp. YIM 132087]|uniref:Cyclase n=1 Tax=Nakamurella alba TaxID=2665158 RepID=A0A7K1FWG2_9ACTN|nr:SRPBCC family protein [Nakamurella alba]MTD17154.1 cyclase [Nakamurella alba]
MPLICLETLVPATVEDCFDLSLSVDAHTASMHDSGERIVGGVRSGMMGPGETVSWRAVHFGIPWRMTSRITRYRRPDLFVDEQVAGPFGIWRHAHLFVPDGAGTRMTDVVHFRSPAGLVGDVVDRVFLVRYMTGLLEQRNRWLVAELTGAAGR